VPDTQTNELFPDGGTSAAATDNTDPKITERVLDGGSEGPHAAIKNGGKS
jgi:hypothetical protein